MSAQARTKPSVASVAIRPATLGDLDALVALEHAAFSGDRAERRAIRHAIGSPSMSLLVALDGGDKSILVAAATLERRKGSLSCRLSSIAVSPGRAGQGLGGIMLDAAEADAKAHGRKTLRLEVRADNGAGIRLYERHGYARFAILEEYYEDGMEAWRYEKAL
ncbi:N-acetyltransferase [Methylobacterium sp. 10]|uniref:GNAT family N-acetyltransferase n=1 Tax=Methylobacterium sp. 10 TaxID=1101191 RepID=UPI00048A3E29|nr:N-acetyltransferase [Methylobacterium sp. 10]